MYFIKTLISSFVILSLLVIISILLVLLLPVLGVSLHESEMIKNKNAETKSLM